MGITASTSAIEATRNIGKYEGSASYDREENVASVGLDIGIAGLGVTTDHGGAVTGKIDLGIVGMEIEWGREGGIVDTQAGFGLFETKVEAKNCVVTERKLIAGQVVATRTYRDPGCKLPEPLAPAPEPEPEPTPEGIKLPNTDEVGWVVFDMEEKYLLYRKTTIRTVSDIQEKNRNANSLPFKVVSTNNPYGSADYTINKNTRVHNGQAYDTIDGNHRIFAAQPYPQNTFIFWYVAAFFGSVGKIKEFIALNKEKNDLAYAYDMQVGTRYNSYYFYTPTQFIPLISRPAKPFLPTGNTPPMNNDCCEEVNDKLDDLLEIIDVKRFKKNGFPLPAYLLAPGCKSDAVVKNKTYYDLVQQVFRAIAHTAIVNPEVSIADNDSAKAGNQSLQIKYLSATGWAEGVTKLLLEAVDDGNVGTNCDIRTGVTVTQLLVAVADLSYKVDAIIDCIGVTTKRSKATVTTSYNLVVDDGSKGFGKESQQQIDKNTDLSTEALLPQLLRTRENTIVKEEIHPKSQTLVELIQSLIKSGNR